MLDLAVAVADPAFVRSVPLRRDTRLVAGHLRAAPATCPNSGSASGCRRTGTGLAAGARADRSAHLADRLGRGAREDGFNLRELVPTGRFRARHGEFDATGTDPRAAHCATAAARRAETGSHRPVSSSSDCRGIRHLAGRLCADNPGSWFSPFAAAVTALRTGLVPAELRGALYRALTGLPGVSARARANIDGQDCLALVHDAGRTRTELMIDPPPASSPASGTHCARLAQRAAGRDGDQHHRGAHGGGKCPEWEVGHPVSAAQPPAGGVAGPAEYTRYEGADRRLARDGWIHRYRPRTSDSGH